MEASGLILGILQYAGLYFQFNAGLNDVKMDNRVSGNALFIEVPRDITTHSGEDVEMACSFRGAGSTSYSLEIQWWYSRKHRDQQDFTSYATNNVGTLEEMSNDATKISVVKVAGSNISHKLRLSSVKPTDEGTYECHVIDHSGLVVQRYRVQAYLQVAPERSLEMEPEHVSQQRSALPTGSGDVGGRAAGSTSDCTGSCVL